MVMVESRRWDCIHCEIPSVLWFFRSFFNKKLAQIKINVALKVSLRANVQRGTASSVSFHLEILLLSRNIL